MRPPSSLLSRAIVCCLNATNQGSEFIGNVRPFGQVHILWVFPQLHILCSSKDIHHTPEPGLIFSINKYDVEGIAWHAFYPDGRSTRQSLPTWIVLLVVYGLGNDVMVDPYIQAVLASQRDQC